MPPISVLNSWKLLWMETEALYTISIRKVFSRKTTMMMSWTQIQDCHVLIKLTAIKKKVILNPDNCKVLYSLDSSIAVTFSN